jgi:hypothetical protein
MENANIPPVKIVRKDALINITISTGMLEKFQEVLRFLAKDLTNEQYAKYQQEFKDYKIIAQKEKEFSEPWMYPVTTMTFFLEKISIEAEKQGFVFEVDLEEYIKTQVTKSGGIPLDSQSPKQPE